MPATTSTRRHNLKGSKFTTTGPHSYQVMSSVFQDTNMFIKKMRNAIMSAEKTDKRNKNSVKVRDFTYLKYLVNKLNDSYYYLCRHEVMGVKTARAIRKGFAVVSKPRTAEEIKTDDAKLLRELVQLQDSLNSLAVIEEPKSHTAAVKLYRSELINFINEHPVIDSQPYIPLLPGGEGGYLSVYNGLQYWYRYIEKAGLAHTQYPSQVDYAKNKNDPFLKLLDETGLGLGVAGVNGDKSVFQILSQLSTRIKDGKTVTLQPIDPTASKVFKVKSKKNPKETTTVTVKGVFNKRDGMRIVDLFSMKDTVSATITPENRAAIEDFTTAFKDVKIELKLEKDEARETARQVRTTANNEKRKATIAKKEAEKESKQRADTQQRRSRLQERSQRSQRSSRAASRSVTPTRGRNKNNNTRAVSRSTSRSRSSSR